MSDSSLVHAPAITTRSRDLALEDWKKGGKAEADFDNTWKNATRKFKQVRHPPSHHTSLTLRNLNQLYMNRAKELVRYYCLCCSLRCPSNLCFCRTRNNTLVLSFGVLCVWAVDWLSVCGVGGRGAGGAEGGIV